MIKKMITHMTVINYEKLLSIWDGKKQQTKALQTDHNHLNEII